jgi:hypothetical protein
VPYRAIAAAALERWRIAHRLMEALDEGTPEWQDAYLGTELAKADYQAAVEEARRHHTPLPPPFDDVSGTDPRE